MYVSIAFKCTVGCPTRVEFEKRNLLKRSKSKCKLDTRCVRKESSQTSLEEQAEIQHPVAETEKDQVTNLINSAAQSVINA